MADRPVSAPLNGAITVIAQALTAGRRGSELCAQPLFLTAFLCPGQIVQICSVSSIETRLTCE